MRSSTLISEGVNPKESRVIDIARFLAAAGIGCIFVWATYVFFIVCFLDNAVILRSNRNLMDAKLAQLTSPNRAAHLIIVSGSNGFYSIDSDALSAATDMPVVNAALQWSYTMYMLERVATLSMPRDVVLLPLEYQYFTSLTQNPPLESCHYLTQDRAALNGLTRYATAILNCNPSVIFDGLRLQFLTRLGAHFPSADATDNMTPSGDILENVPAAATYRRPTTWTMTPPYNRPFGNQRLATTIRALVAKNVRVFLTYPVAAAPDDPYRAIADASWVKAYRAWGESLGATVISTPQAHVFPVECFFDSGYHLHRGCTAQNSAKYAEALRPYLTGK